MTSYTDLELDRILDQFLGEGPGEAPDRAIDLALDRIDHVRQRRTGAAAGWARMPATARLLLAAALVIAALAVGALLIAGRTAEEPVPTQAVPTLVPSVPPSSEASPSATPLAAVTPAPVTPAMAIAIEARNRADQAITASKGPLGINDTEQTRLIQLIMDVQTELAGRSDPATALESVDAFAADAIAKTERLAEDRRVRLRSAVAALQGAVRSRPFIPEALEPGSWYTTAFMPATALIVPEGWSRNIEDSEVLVLRKGGVTLAVTKMATEATEEGIAKSLGNPPADILSPPPEAVTFPSYVGFTSGLSEGGGTLWFTESLQAFDSEPTDVVRQWVFQAGSHVVTVTLSGPPDEVAAAIPEVEAMLATMVVAQVQTAPIPVNQR